MGLYSIRDLVADDIQRIKDLVREALWTLKSQYPHTSLVLLSPLAEGGHSGAGYRGPAGGSAVLAIGVGAVVDLGNRQAGAGWGCRAVPGAIWPGQPSLNAAGRRGSPIWDWRI